MATIVNRCTDKFKKTTQVRLCNTSFPGCYNRVVELFQKAITSFLRHNLVDSALDDEEEEEEQHDSSADDKALYKYFPIIEYITNLGHPTDQKTFSFQKFVPKTTPAKKRSPTLETL